jgi:hypothetical protein
MRRRRAKEKMEEENDIWEIIPLIILDSFKN